MNIIEKVSVTCFVAGFCSFGLADNPISTYHYLADPSCAADGDTFYILTDVDDNNTQTTLTYDITGLSAFTSEDMKNWTDHGMIFKSKREFGDYPSNTWASGIAVKNGKIYIVYPDGASGVGMITASAIDGPYTDPIQESHGVHYIAANWGESVIGGCDGIGNCFDPGIFFDDDGTGYVIFGGGGTGQRPTGNNFDIIKFNEVDDKIIIDKNSLKRISLPNSLEAPYLHKKGDYYYLSFNNNGYVIDYGMSKDIMGPYDYVGTVIPGVAAVPGAHGVGGNNHQGFALFKGKWYAVYHDRRLVTSDNHPTSCTRQGVCSVNPNYENHRSVAIDELTWNGDKMNELVFTNEGPKQIKNFDPYRTYKATTSSKQLNIRSRTDWTKGKPVVHVLTPLASKESWIRVSGVDFGKGAENLRIKASNVGEDNKVEIHTDSASGTLAGSCELAKTSGWNDYKDNDCVMTGLSGVVGQVFFVFKGSKDSTMGLLEWEFQGTKREPEPQKPFGGKAWTIPGVIQMENFDVPGYGEGNDSFYDNDSLNNGESDYRKEDAPSVDLYLKSDGRIVVGYIQKDDWLEYTVNVAKDGDYTMFAAVASDGGSSFNLSVDGEDITEDVAVPAARKDENEEQNFDDYSKVAANVSLKAGEHILRFTATADWMDIDYINFVEGRDAKDDMPIGGETNRIVNAGIGFHLNVESKVYNVFNLRGNRVGSVNLSGMNAVQALKAARFGKGVYMLKQVDGSKKMMVNAAK